MHPEIAMPEYGAIGFQRSTGQINFPRYTIDVVSSELPCGAAWLASCLLELNVSIWRFWNVSNDHHWQPYGERRYRYMHRHSPWSRVIPGLTDGREFTFLQTPVPRFSHELPGAWPCSPRIVLIVRDPRDALYSQWRRMRAQRSVTDFVSWVNEKDSRWACARPRAYLLYLATWVCFAEQTGASLLVLRFEDFKQDGERALKQVISFLGDSLLRASSNEITAAVEASTFERLQTTERSMIARGILDTPVNFRGRAFEYREHFDEKMHAAFALSSSDFLEWLGYAPVDRAPRISDMPANAIPWISESDRLVDEQTIEATSIAQTWLRGGTPRLSRVNTIPYDRAP
jgi:hypothetical protein